jgi:competence protein ComEC
VLAISGLHMGLVMGFFFSLTRRFCALIPPLAARCNSQKIAAPLTIAVGWLYLALSDWGIPAQRALIMGSMMMLALLLDRRAISLRNLSIAATAILLWNPVAVLSISFQLSFAAVLSLIVWFEAQSITQSEPAHPSWKPSWLRALQTIIISTTWATIATTPLVIDTFQRINVHAFWTNLVAIPLTSLWLMPVGFLATVSTLWGGQAWLFWVWEQGLQLLIWIATTAASMAWGIRILPIPHPSFITFTTIGFVWFFLWTSHRIRWLGMVSVIAGVMCLGIGSHRPDGYVFYTPSKPVIGWVQEGALQIRQPHRYAQYATQQWALEHGISTIEYASSPYPDWIKPYLRPYAKTGIDFCWKHSKAAQPTRPPHTWLPF